MHQCIVLVEVSHPTAEHKVMLYGDDCTDYNKNAVIVQAVHDFIDESDFFF